MATCITNNICNSPLVSIITPVFNASRFLPSVITSVRNQHGLQNYEHILIDDCSTDDSWSVLTNYADSDNRIKIIHLDFNSGPIEARNKGISVARGKYLAFLDADDSWLPDKLHIQTRFMEETGAVLSFTDYRFISEDGELIGRRLCGPNRIGVWKHCMTRSGLGCLTIMINRNIATNFSFVKVDSITDRSEDFLSWLRIIRKYGYVLRVPQDLARYRLVSGSRSSNIILKAQSIWHIYRNVEKFTLPIACLFFLSFALSAFLKRQIYRPKLLRCNIDSSIIK
jgi:glycosyltransferase involved in cell wall biosynthesis